MRVPNKLPGCNLGYIPSVFDESLSYYEQVCKLTGVVNELIDIVNSYADEYKAYTDEQINKLNADITERVRIIYDTINVLDNQLNNKIDGTTLILQEDYKARIEQLNKSLSALIDLKIFNVTKDTDKKIATVNVRITAEIQALRDYIDSSVIDIKVVNPVTGLISTIDEALSSLYNLHRYGAFTAAEYDAKELEAYNYDYRGLTAADYDLDGKALINAHNYKLKQGRAFNMTSDTTPEGYKATATNYQDGNAWWVFDNNPESAIINNKVPGDITAVINMDKPIIPVNVEVGVFHTPPLADMNAFISLNDKKVIEFNLKADTPVLLNTLTVPSQLARPTTSLKIHAYGSEEESRWLSSCVPLIWLEEE